MGIFNLKRKVRAETEPEVSDVLLRALVGTEELTKKQALEIPEVSACIDLISGTVASMPIKLYVQKNGEVEEVKEDRRLKLLNKDTGDTLTAKQFWKAMVEDYYLDKGGYAYINGAKSLHYVEATYVNPVKNKEPIFKDYNIYVHDRAYYPWEFLKLLRKTKDGCTSISLLEEKQLVFSVSYETYKYQKNLVKKGGNKRGFLKSAKKLSRDAMDVLKEGFKRLYSNSEENVIVLNDGIEFQEASNTSVEMQLNENKKADGNAIASIFMIPYAMITGKASKEDRENYLRFCIMPLLSDIECSIDRDMLREDEKDTMYFAFDTKELTRGSIEERYKAYEIGLRNNFLQVDEVRDKEDLEPLGINWIRLGLDSVLYDPKTNTVYTPNTNVTKEMSEQIMKGGEGNENRNQE